MSPGEGARRTSQSRSGAEIAVGYRAARARLMRPKSWPRPSCGPACWLPDLIAFNENLRRLFLRAPTSAAMAPAERIRDAVAAHYGVTVVEIVGNRTIRRCAWPRQVAMYLCARHTGLPSRDIAALFGGRDPSTVRFAVRAVARRGKDPTLAADLSALIAKCRLRGSG